MKAKFPNLTGRRILIVEDSAIVAMDLECILQEAGCIVIGPTADISEALHLTESEQIEAAVLDINLSGVEVYPVARKLRDQSVPFAFISGYNTGSILPEEF